MVGEWTNTALFTLAACLMKVKRLHKASSQTREGRTLTAKGVFVLITQTITATRGIKCGKYFHGNREMEIITMSVHADRTPPDIS